MMRWVRIWGPALVWVVAMQVLTGRPPPAPGLGWLARHDKLAHLVYFGVFGLLVYRAGRQSSGAGPAAAARRAFLLTLAYGTLDELKQVYLPHRQVEWADWAANVAGACLPLLMPWWSRRSGKP